MISTGMMMQKCKQQKITLLSLKFCQWYLSGEKKPSIFENMLFFLQSTMRKIILKRATTQLYIPIEIFFIICVWSCHLILERDCIQNFWHNLWILDYIILFAYFSSYVYGPDIYMRVCSDKEGLHCVPKNFYPGFPPPANLLKMLLPSPAIQGSTYPNIQGPSPKYPPICTYPSINNLIAQLNLFTFRFLHVIIQRERT